MSMHPVYVLEGPDCSGKTTLGKYLTKVLDAKYIHLTYRFKDRMHQYHTAALERVLKHAQNQPVVLDRWWPSEIVYAAAFRGGTPWPGYQRMLDRVAMKHGFTYIFCLPKDREGYLQAWGNLREQRYREKAWALKGRTEATDNMAKVYDLFNDTLKWMRPRNDVAIYDYLLEGDRLDEVYYFVSSLAFENFVALPDFCADPQDRRFCGNIDGDMLVIAEQSNPKGRHKTWPFAEYANSSLFMSEVMEHLDIPEYKLGWINLFGLDGRVQWTQREIEFLKSQYRHVLALGGKTVTAARNAGFNTREAYHPAYVKRFLNYQGPDHYRHHFIPVLGVPQHEFSYNLHLARPHS